MQRLEGEVAPEDAPAPPPSPSARPHRRGRGRHAARRPVGRWAVAASTLAALLPIAVATARTIARDWLPIGDNAYFAIRARDVLTEHPPLLGTWTSASLTTGNDLNNPGPLYFDALAVPTTLFEGGAGLALAVALLNALAVVGTVWLAWRRGGAVAATAAAAVTAAVGWSMGSELLFDPWQPHSLLLPFLCFLAAVWATTCGDLVALPLAVGLASYVIQTHLSYGYVVPALAAWAVVGLALHLRRARRDDPDRWGALRRRTGRAVAASALVALACWSQPLLEEVTADGPGNLTRLARVMGDGDVTTTGAELGTRLVASVVGLPPWWLRPSFGDAFLVEGSVPSVGFLRPGDPDLPSLAASRLALAAVALVLAAAWAVSRWRDDRPAGRAAVTAGVGLASGLVTAIRMPLGVFGIAPHQFRWLWPLAAFAAFSVVIAAVAAARVERRYALPAFTAATAALAVLNLPTYEQHVGPSADDWSIPAARDLGRQLDVLEGQGTLLVDTSEILAFDPYTIAVMAELQRRDVEFVVDEPGQVRQLGDARDAEGVELGGVLHLRSGDFTRTPPPGTAEVARHDGLSAAGQRELQELIGAIAGHLRDGARLELTDRGRDVADDGELRAFSGFTRGEGDADALLASRELVVMVRAGLVEVEGGWSGRYRRYADLQLASDRETVALFLGPPPA